MSEPTLDYDPIHATIYQVLCLASCAHTALDGLKDQWTDSRSAEAARRLAAQLAQEKIFSARDIGALEQVLELLNGMVDAGWRVQVIADPHSVEGAYVDHVLTAEAERLREKIWPIQELHATLLRLERLRRMEQVAVTLRGHDMS
ncbi:hypothetical protein [Candidatus Halocynthiibacter alkanivorans]|uniref:hypothetical protein n=1 Tax=Candidatus Halocynthiibacter alkanivorans TaxID=2267619 RepID=UPI000DF271CD|nr:hypothetical protein [Candidatus Halocynthiibacter alkanivorans]